MEQTRNSSIDFLKFFLAILIIIYHAGLPYFIGPDGFWFTRSTTYDPHFFTPWYLSFNAFVLNTFFFIAGMFSFYSIRRHNVAEYLKNRIKRLFIPLVLGFLLILPPLEYYYYLTYQPVSHVSFIEYLFSYWFGLAPKPANWVGHYPDMNLGHLWFLEHLLIYSFLLATLFYAFTKSRINLNLNFYSFTLLLFLSAMICTYEMRIYHPVTEMTAFLGFIQLDYTHVLQNFLLFFGGVYFAMENYTIKISSRMKKILFYMGLVLALLPFITYYYATSFLDLFTNTALLSIWESLTAVTVTLGSVTYLETVIKSIGVANEN